jgi:hypothetical protein
MMERGNVKLISVAQTLGTISDNLFNNLIWPDFTVILLIRNAVLNPYEITMEKKAHIEGITIKLIFTDEILNELSSIGNNNIKLLE